MPFLAVSFESAIPLRRCCGSYITIINGSAIDVFFDEDVQRINSSAQGSTPNGTKLGANGGQFIWERFPGVVWLRTQSQQANVEVHG